MMGFGPYGGNGGSYLSPTSSNLSASAPPFTIDRSGPKPPCPLVDLTEPSYLDPMNSSLHNWLPSLTPTSEPKFISNPQLELNSGPSSNAYGFGGLQTVESSNLNTHLPHLSTAVSASVDGFSYGQSSDSGATGFVEVKPYYPSYLSPAAHKDGPLGISDQTSYDWLSNSSRVAALDGSSNNDYSMKFMDSKYAGHWGGMWDGFAEWKHGKQGQVDGSLCSKETDIPLLSMYENYMNQESHICKGLNRGEVASHGINMLDLEKHAESVNTEKLNDQSFSGKTSNSMPVDHSRPIVGSLSGLPETHLESPSFIFGTSSVNHQIPYVYSNEKRFKQDANNSTSILKSSPALVIGPPAVGSGSGSSTPIFAPFNNLNLGSNTIDTDMSGEKACRIKGSHSQLSSEHNLVFDSSQANIHPERDDPISSISFLRKKEETLNKDCISNVTLHHMLRVQSELQTSNVSHDGFNLDLNVNESINSVEDSSECVDHYNPAVDSPCWKGVPVSRSSPFDASDIVPEMRKLEVCNKSNVQGKQIFPLNTGDNVSSLKPNKTLTYHQFGCLENDSEFPLNISSVTNSAFGEQKSDDVGRVGHQSETNGIKHSDDNHEHGSRSIGCSDLKTSPIRKQNLQGDGLTSGNINETIQYISSHLPFPVENVISPSLGDVSSKLNKSNEGPSTPTIDVLMLVRTIQNLSELLLLHCASGSYQLKQKDLEAIQSVINNLSVCMSKNSEKMIPIQESTSSVKDTSDYARELNDIHIHKGVTEDNPKLTKTVGIKALFDCQNVHKGNNYCLSFKKDDEMSDSVSVRGDLDMVDEDKATQALKKVLAENFHDEEETQPQTFLYKNLWLEAEAALCSLNYKARYNRMKIEMEKFKLPKFIDARENTITTDVKKPSMSKASPDPDAVDTSSPKADDCPTTESQASSVLSTSSQPDDVMARLHILKCRIENSNSETVANVEKPSSSKVSPDSGKIGEMLPETHEGKIGSPKPDISLQASSNSSINNPTNKCEASVLARFHILKSRADNCSPISTERQRSPEIVNLGYASERQQYWPVIGLGSEVGSANVQPKPISQHHDADSTEGQLIGSEFDMHINDDPSLQSHRNYRDTADSTEGQLTGREFHMLVNDDPLVQSHRTNRPENSLLAGWYDRVSLDWEHVGKEELGPQYR